ncbi:DUF4391 domain-containing protein [Lachnobacterium bovis]|uniref:DUF4391 domain-containing protein n=1 Tax=Lachnobacterium bovis TaxID=140626 RepID=UPI0003B38298|nr:DUF4391 domain-containing protein [Lachnobacterium bovis]
MFGLPSSTEIRKPVHKKLLYQKFHDELSGDKKERFDADISRIIITNEISETSVNTRSTEKIQSIFVVQIELKNKDYNDRNIILISRLFGQNLLMILHYGNEYQLAIYETRLLKSEWKNEFELSLIGLDLSTIWDGLIMEVSGIVADEDNTLVEQIGIEVEKEKLKKMIVALERKARKETQSKKKYEMFQRVKEYQNKLEELNNE